jgi:outer membrane protein OmpA-like peptidoglycan-associated protein
MEFIVRCIKKREKEYSSGFTGEVLQLFGVTSIENPKEIYYCDVAYIVASIKDGDEFYVQYEEYKTKLRINHTEFGNEFVETEKDKTSLNNLINLPICNLDFRILGEQKDPQKKEPDISLNPYKWPILAFLTGLLPFLFCLLFCKDEKKDCKDCPVVIRVDTVRIATPCPGFDNVIKSTHVHFNFDSSGINDIQLPNKFLKEKCIDTLKVYADLLKNSQNMYAVLRGFTDNKGKENYNINLSEKRVTTIANYFFSQGIRKEQIIQSEKFGKKYPLQSNKTELGRAFNRRVEITVFGLKSK